MFIENNVFRNTTLFILFLISFIAMSCSTGSDGENELNLEGKFSLESFQNQETYSIKENSEFIFIGTESGLFAKQKPESTWLELINEDVSVRAFEQISENEIIATLYFNNQDSATIGRTINFGESWLPYRNGFDPVFNSIPTIIEQSKNDENTIYAGGSILRVAKSADNAENWNIVFGSWEGFGSIFFIKTTSNSVWTGGSTAKFAPLLYRSNDDGVNWDEILVAENVETIVYDVAIHHQAPSRIMAGLGIGICKTTDDGETWNTAFNQAGIYSFTQSPRNPDIVYASGRNATGTLFFLVSDDFGDTWQTIEFEDSPGEIHVNDMVSVMEDGKEVIYLGTNKGLYAFIVE